jgi:hypothetical protein
MSLSSIVPVHVILNRSEGSLLRSPKHDGWETAKRFFTAAQNGMDTIDAGASPRVAQIPSQYRYT